MHFWSSGRLFGCAAAALFAFSTPETVYAQAQTYTFNIPADDLASALRSFARQAHQQVVFDGTVVAGKTSRPVVGTFSANDAIKTLLEGTGLGAHVGSKGEFLVTLPSSTESRQSTAGAEVTSSIPGGADLDRLQEVVVTAEKHEERLQDVPLPVTALSADQLTVSEQVRLRDFAFMVPGLSAGAGIYPGANTSLYIRGIPFVNVYVDDVPVSSNIEHGGGGDLPELDPGDLAGVEVLRGPQGTLYGAASMGGLIKYVTTAPSTDALSGKIDLGASTVYNGAEPGYSFRAAINVPVSDDLAVRASGFWHQDPGYIDNPSLHLDGVNEGESKGGRLSALWKPSETVSLRIDALYQTAETGGEPDADVLSGLGDLQQNYLIRTGGYQASLNSYSAVLKAKLGAVDLISTTVYSNQKTNHALDYSGPFGDLAVSTFGPSADAVPLSNIDNIESVKQETRLTGRFGESTDWLLGAFYDHEDEYSYQEADGVNAATGYNFGPVFQYYFTGKNEYVGYAGFANLTYHFTDAFDVQIGARESHDETHYRENVELVAPTTTITAPQSSGLDKFNYLVTPQFKLSPDVMVYARFASGYGPGGPNAASPGVPEFFQAETSTTYEAGIKGEFLDHHILVDASIYHIHLDDIQVTEISQTQIYFNGNAGTAKSDGVDLSITAKPLRGLTVGGWIAYDDAALTEDFPSDVTYYGRAGSPLPQASRWSGNLTAQEEFPLWNAATGFVGGVWGYLGDRYGGFTSTQVRQYYPPYARLDLNSGINISPWVITVYATNVTDKRGILGGGIDAAFPYSFTYIQPRTVGLKFERRF